ncbi:MAG TPA: hypothetical protein VGT44_04015 [Ktedonobacteraceae bacterium]|nr:hypothetical protein [Ktedonobacteraceae bacterium]
MKSTFLSRLQTSARYALIGALVLVIGVPLYQFLVLTPSGYGNALMSVGQSLNWIHAHIPLFLGYRALLIVGFSLIVGLPFALFRIIVAQEVLGQDDVSDDDEDLAEEGEDTKDEEEEDEAQTDSEQSEEGADAVANAQEDAMPDFAWRGRGFAVLAAWLGVGGLVLFPLATLASTLYLSLSVPSAASLTGLFAVLTFTVGGGLLALSCLFFGAVITRRGRRLWPDVWLTFGYVALAITLLLSGNAVDVALAPDAGQSVLSTPAILLFALWTLWFGVMVVRLKPE